jgi:NADH-quinone oxidoreductase subunit L
MILAVLSVIGGYIGLPKALLGGAWFEHFLHPVFAKGAEIGKLAEGAGESHATEYVLMVAAVAFVVVMIFTAKRYYLDRAKDSEQFERGFGGLYKLVYNKYYIDELYDKIIVNPLVKGSDLLWQKFDVLIIDGFFNGTAWLAGQWAISMRKLQTGMVRSYAFVFLGGAIFVIGYLILSK